MKILTPFLWVFVTFMHTLGFSFFSFVTFQNRTLPINYKPEERVSNFKHSVAQAFSLPANQIKLMMYGEDELDDNATMGSFDLQKLEPLLALIKDIAYPSYYDIPIKRANEAFAKIKRFKRLKAKSGQKLTDEIRVLKNQMQSILHYSLPTTFMNELIARFRKEKGYCLFPGNQIPAPQVLMEHAIAHMKDSLNPSSASEDIEGLQKYLTNAISFQLALAYVVFDEGENDINNRFFKCNRDSFIEHYEEFERAQTGITRSNSAYEVIREKIKDAHKTITVRVYLEGQSYTIAGRRMDTVSFLKQELGRQANKAPYVEYSLGVHGRPLENYDCPSHIENKSKDQKMNDYSRFSDLEQFIENGSIVIDAAAL